VTTQQTTTASAVPGPREHADAVAVAPAHSGSAAQPSWRLSALTAFTVFASLRVAYVALTVLGRQLAPTNGSLLRSWLQWDGWQYYRIAEHGYGSLPQDVAFFPLFPMLVHGLNAVLPGDALVPELIVGNLAAYGALVLLHRLVLTELGRPLADRTVWLLGVFPTAYFLAAPYNHSLFLLLAVGCLYAIRRKTWWLAGVLGALAGATRSDGVLLMLPFAYEYLRVRGWDWRRIRGGVLWLAAVPAGLLAFAAYCWSRYDDPLAFSHAQSYWGKQVSWPGYTLWEAVRQLGERSLVHNYTLAGDLAATVLGIALLVGAVWGPWALDRQQRYLIVYAGPVLLLPLFFPLAQGDPVSGMARYLLDIAVLFVVPARLLGRQSVERATIVVALALQFGYLLMYLRGAWTF
jgi:hypothetical protein